MESLASRTSSAALQLRFAQNDIGTLQLVLVGDIGKHLLVVPTRVFFLSFSKWYVVGDAADSCVSPGIFFSHLNRNTHWPDPDATRPIKLHMPCLDILFCFLHRISRVPSRLSRNATPGNNRQ